MKIFVIDNLGVLCSRLTPDVKRELYGALLALNEAPQRLLLRSDAFQCSFSPDSGSLLVAWSQLDHEHG